MYYTLSTKTNKPAPRLQSRLRVWTESGVQSISYVNGRSVPVYIGHILLYTMHCNYGNTVRRQSTTSSVCGTNTADRGSANSVSSAFVIFMKNVYSKELIETFILYLFKTGFYEWIANMRRHYFILILNLRMRFRPSFLDGYFSMVSYPVDCGCFWLFKSIRIRL
jgi:hypothetical protein